MRRATARLASWLVQSFLPLIAVGHVKSNSKRQRKAANDAWDGGSAMSYYGRFRRAHLLRGTENKCELNKNQQRPQRDKCPAVKFPELHLVPSRVLPLLTIYRSATLTNALFSNVELL